MNVLGNKEQKQRGMNYMIIVTICLLACLLAPASPSTNVLYEVVACREEGRYVGWPSAVAAADGSVIAVFSGDRVSHICPSGKVQMVRSTDCGRTWSAPVTIGDTPIDDRDAAIVQLPDGELIVSWFTSIGYLDIPRWKQQDKRDPGELATYFGRWCVRSRDGGKTWSKPEKMTILGSTPHGPIVLKDGTLLQVGHYFPGAKDSPEATASRTLCSEICCERSTDGGKTWQLLCSMFPDTNGEKSHPNMFWEPHVAELPDGTLVAQIRYHGPDGCFRQSVSRDGGRTWSPMKKTTIQAGPSAMHLLALDDGRLVVSYSRRLNGWGKGGFAAFSSDCGKHWTAADGFRLRQTVPGTPMYETGYPASVRLKDGSMLTVYYEPESAHSLPVLMATRWMLPAAIRPQPTHSSGLEPLKDLKN